MVTGQHTWERWSELRVGDPSTQYKYWETLAREQGWTLSFAETVFYEYRKFLFLVLTSPQAVIAPPPIQAALNLHRSLPSWRELPERGELERRFQLPGTPEQTRAAYLNAFGAYAPESIWPSGLTPKQPKESHRARHWTLALVVAMVMGSIWGDLLPGAYITPALIGLGILVVGLMKHWHPDDGRVRPSESTSGADGIPSIWDDPDDDCTSDDSDSSDSDSDSDSGDSGDSD